MTTYNLYLESGPRHRKTMVHVLDLLGCIANGPTTEEALAATPEAIRTFRRFLDRHGDAFDPAAPFDTQVVEHITEGDWLGNGSPYILFGPDYEPVTEEQLERYLQRYHWLRDELATWAATQSDAQLDATPVGGGRTGRAVLLHVLGASGGYLSAALGGAPGFSRIATAAERGEIGLADALREAEVRAVEVARNATPEQRATPRERPAGPRTFRQALRRMLEHDWEHLAELSRRPGGPPL